MTEEIWTNQDSDQWVARILQRRQEGVVLVLLTQGPDETLWGLGRQPGSSEYEWWGIAHPRQVPRPAAMGIGEWIHMQEELSAHGDTSLTWVPSLRTERVVRGKGIFTYPLGPVHADVSESLRYDLSVMGDEIVHLTLRHGWKPRHIARLCRGKPVMKALELVERMTATSSFAHQWAFMMAVENAQGRVMDKGVRIYRSVALEMERLASHLGDLAILASSTGLVVAQMDYLHLKEEILRWNNRLFGDRYLRGALGNNRIQVDTRAAPEIIQVGEEAQRITNGLLKTPSFLDRLVGAGRIPKSTVEFVAPVGPVGRACGCKTDVRAVWDYGIYDDISFSIPTSESGDAYARFLVKAREISASINIVRRLLPVVPRDAHPLTHHSRKAEGTGVGVGMVEAARGMLAYAVWLDSSGEHVRHLAVATPSARNWHVVPPAMANGNILQDFPIIDASFLLSVSGWDQ
ncbi:MAG: hydrogenase-3 subunit E [Firmicutes bacterium]|uniref:Hydrogenase-3 subunit E n=1 Tax=Sulfobacillus benefaciens TaxID=453960 RepID=A0A2T2X881_9FIRM|nr:hydrogenase-3 subunit E [Bacillota bacterium]MCL5012573.1 hydrogenase-3 subunit E [Bacillota bacterium]PSR30702.1 MAG: hydrogenase-3 subunit E [Sulfobacillus benefaciens]